jgi:ubiquinone/menaquinone biosynthesis C-methylase UbiE
MPASPSDSPEKIKDANTRYHDVAAESYDSKWGIDFGPIGQQQVRSKVAKALGHDPSGSLGDSLEIGAGTGYFSLNLALQGLLDRVTVTDISPGMLDALSATAADLGVEVEAVVCEAENLPFEDDSFDLVFGHAVLHHIPDLDRAFSEFHRVLRPGGRIIFCGEPSRYGDRLAALPKALGTAAGPVWRLLVGASPAREQDGNGSPHEADHELESEVDVHAFAPADLRALPGRAGFTGVRVSGEEAIANVWGWGVRSLEATAEPETVPLAWRKIAFRGYVVFQKLDTAVLESRLPPELLYNLLLTAEKPA